MKDMFNLSRFLRYSRLYYSNKWLGFVIGPIVSIFVILLLTSEMKSGVNDSFSTLHAAKMDIAQQFIAAFFLTSFVLIFQTVRVMCSGLGVNCKRFAMQDMLVPASATERYCFSLLNITVIMPILFLLIFWGVSSYAESLYYFPTDGVTTSYIHKGLLDFNAITIPAGYERQDILSLEVIHRYFTADNLILIVFVELYFLVASIAMWGQVSFAKNGAVIAAFIHIGILAISGYFLVVFSDMLRASMAEYDLHVIHSYSASLEGSTYNIVTIVALALVYQIITFLKIKNLSVKN